MNITILLPNNISNLDFMFNCTVINFTPNIERLDTPQYLCYVMYKLQLLDVDLHILVKSEETRCNVIPIHKLVTPDKHF